MTGATMVLLLASAFPATAKVEFNRDVRPILSDKCFHCHGPDPGTRKAKLRLDTPGGALADRGGRRAVVPGQPEKSEVFLRITVADPDDRMPPPDSHKRLEPAEIGLIEQWIRQGGDFQPHWSFVSPELPALPVLRTRGWPRNPIDHFVGARLEAVGSAPSPEAGRETLIRRVTLDLTGLPPALADVDAFVADASPDAYDRVVERLLRSTAYSEHQARHWLDAVRYADTHGLGADNARAIWPYRDWVVSAFAGNMPWDRFAREQLAGDLLPHPTREQLVATGFLRCNLTTNEGGIIAEEARANLVRDRVETFATVFLGLTAGCAACHDHKFDPFTQRDFYRLAAYFDNGTDEPLDGNLEAPPPVLVLSTPEQAAELASLTADIADTRRAIFCFEWAFAGTAAAFTPLHERLAELEKRHGKLEKQIARTLIFTEKKERGPTHVLARGEYNRKGEAVSPGTPQMLPGAASGTPPDRLGLARWLTDPSHPLFARVAVNRFWQQHFGTALTRTSWDLGVQGEWPSHPELLDWLATTFVTSGFDVKALHRLIVTSATYRQSSVATPEALKIDPENRLLSRGPSYRLDGEVLRDSALFVSGLLSAGHGGPGVKPYQPGDLWRETAPTGSSTDRFKPDTGESLYRRSLYTFWKRMSPPPAMLTFDAPTREYCNVRRERTNTPLQALVLMNDTQFVEAARRLAVRLMRDAGPGSERRIVLGFRLVTARAPAPDETRLLVRLFEARLDAYRADPAAAKALLGVGESGDDSAVGEPPERAAWTVVANALLNLDEALTTW